MKALEIRNLCMKYQSLVPYGEKDMGQVKVFFVSATTKTTMPGV